MPKEVEFYSSLERDTTDLDLVFKNSTLFFLADKIALLGFYDSLTYHISIGATAFITQKTLMESMKLSKPTFVKYKKQLIGFGLLEEMVEGRSKKLLVKNFYFGKKSLPIKIGADLPKRMDEIRKSMSPDNVMGLQMSLSPSIYNIPISSSPISNTNKSSTNGVHSTPIHNMGIEKKKEKPSYRRYPAEDYKIVMDGFMKYKGVSLKGPELGQARRAIKTMFESERKPKEILDFMKWLRENESNPETPWVRTWTIWTVQKKLNEFVAGKLGKPKLEDEYEIIK